MTPWAVARQASLACFHGVLHEILQAKILEWVAIPFSRGSCHPNDWTWVSCIAGRFFTIWANRETLRELIMSAYFAFCGINSYQWLPSTLVFVKWQYSKFVILSFLSSNASLEYSLPWYVFLPLGSMKHFFFLMICLFGLIKMVLLQVMKYFYLMYHNITFSLKCQRLRSCIFQTKWFSPIYLYCQKII